MYCSHSPREGFALSYRPYTSGLLGAPGVIGELRRWQFSIGGVPIMLLYWKAGAGPDKYWLQPPIPPHVALQAAAGPVRIFPEGP